MMRNGEGKYVEKEKGNHACDNVENIDDHKIYASMARMSSDDERSIEMYGNSL